MGTIYVCTYIYKAVEEDGYEKGLVGGQRRIQADRMQNLFSTTLRGLLARLADHVGFILDDVFISESVTNRLGCGRLETVGGDAPSAEQLASWRLGKTKLYLADYTFMVEKRDVSPISLSEFDEAGIKHHD